MNELVQKEVVSRDNVLADSINIMGRLEKRKQLSMQFKDEPGHGLGPTYEFFSLLADQISQKTIDGKPIWRRIETDFSLFPSPFDLKKLSPEQVKELTDTYQLAGTFIAKSIADDKLIDLPISTHMWNLLLGKVSCFIVLKIYH